MSKVKIDMCQIAGNAYRVKEEYETWFPNIEIGVHKTDQDTIIYFVGQQPQ